MGLICSASTRLAGRPVFGWLGVGTSSRMLWIQHMQTAIEFITILLGLGIAALTMRGLLKKHFPDTFGSK